MRALYNCSFADPWLEVAKILNDQYQIQPVYWIGHDDDFSRDLVPAVFPDFKRMGLKIRGLIK